VFLGHDIDDGNGGGDVTMTEDTFRTTLQAATFRWPLKPYGMDKEGSLSKTATVNKGAETRIYMSLLEQQQLYNPRDPTGPLPTSLRPQLNQRIQHQPLDVPTTRRTYEAFIEYANADPTNKAQTTSGLSVQR
jgi:hypothetical protein